MDQLLVLIKYLGGIRENKIYIEFVNLKDQRFLKFENNCKEFCIL